jgi:hypothetical protein
MTRWQKTTGMLNQGIKCGLKHGVALKGLFSANMAFICSIGLQVVSSVR